MKYLTVFKSILLLAFVANNLMSAQAFCQRSVPINMSFDSSFLSKEKTPGSIQLLPVERLETDTASKARTKNLYYDLKLLGIGGGLSQDSWLIDIDLVSVALGYGTIPLLISFQALEFQTVLPWGSKVTSTYSIGVRYIWSKEGDSFHRYVFGESNWGTYYEEELENGEETIEKEYACWYFDLGFGAILQSKVFEIHKAVFNGLEARLGWRAGNVEGDVDNPMLGFYALVKFRFGWAGVKAL